MSSMTNSKLPYLTSSFKLTSSSPKKKSEGKSRSANRTLLPTLFRKSFNSSSILISPNTSLIPSMVGIIYSLAKLSSASGFKPEKILPKTTTQCPVVSPHKPKSKSEVSTKLSSNPNKTLSPVSSGLISTLLTWESVALIINSLISSEGPLPPEDTPMKLSRNLVSNTSRVSCFMGLQEPVKPSLPDSWLKPSTSRILKLSMDLKFLVDLLVNQNRILGNCSHKPEPMNKS